MLSTRYVTSGRSVAGLVDKFLLWCLLACYSVIDSSLELLMAQKRQVYYVSKVSVHGVVTLGSHFATSWIKTFFVIYFQKKGKFFDTFNHSYYSIAKDTSADFGVNSKIVQIRPTVKAVSTKISNSFFFFIFVNILIFLRENKEASFLLFWIFRLKQP